MFINCIDSYIQQVVHSCLYSKLDNTLSVLYGTRNLNTEILISMSTKIGNSPSYQTTNITSIYKLLCGIQFLYFKTILLIL